MENKTSKYLKYAIGEIVLVVIGILIALQINNWNEQIKLDKSINSHLEILKQNLIEDKIQLQNLKEKITNGKAAADSTILQIMTIVPVDIHLKKYLALLLLEYNFSPNTNAFETINQSNEIPSLKNELRTAILDYYALIERTKEREIISNTQIKTKYEPYVYQEYPNIFQKNNEWDILATIYEKDPRPSTLIDKDRFLNDKTFEALIVARYYQLIALEKFYEDLIVSSNKIVSIINKNK
ncbi:DUF6090 family protein [Polaribacter porphyrae]|nr:DUF6090 family protein [Polaribacter porphyrae]